MITPAVLPGPGLWHYEKAAMDCLCIFWRAAREPIKAGEPRYCLKHERYGKVAQVIGSATLTEREMLLRDDEVVLCQEKESAKS